MQVEYAPKMDYCVGMSEERLSVSIRMTRDLTQRLKQAANDRSHSMNAEIVQRLEASFLDDSAPITPEELDESYLDAAEMYIISADDEAVMRLLGKRFTFRRK